MALGEIREVGHRAVDTSTRCLREVMVSHLGEFCIDEAWVDAVRAERNAEARHEPVGQRRRRSERNEDGQPC